jgi:MFS family permease
MTPKNDNPTRAGWLNATVLAVGLASLFSDVGHEMATAALPGLMASLGKSSAALGIIEGLADASATFAKLFSGLYSDRLARRKPLAVAGYFLTASGMASFAFATSSWHVLIGRTLGWFGRGVKSPVKKVLLAEATTKETYGRAFGLERAMDSAGAVVGPSIALGIAASGGVRVTFLATLVPGVLAALVIATMVKEKPHTPQPNARLFGSFAKTPAAFRKFLLGVGLAGLGDFSNTLLILWAAEAWTPLYGRAHATLLAMGFYIGYNAVYTVTCLVSGQLADRFPKRWVLAGGYALAIIPALALLAPGASFLKYAIVFGTSGLYMGVWETVESSSAAAYLPASIRGTGFGLLETVNGFGDLFSSIIVGVLWVRSPAFAMTYVMATSVAGALVIGLTRPAEEAPPPAAHVPSAHV